MLVEARDLGKDYGQVTAVKELSLDISPGEVFGLLGPNGAGKTTTISMIAGILSPTRGTVKIAGHDIRRESFQARRALGVVPQELAVYGELSAVENLRFFGALYGIRGAALDRNVDWALELAGLRDRATEPVSRFSGGMKRRLNLSVGLIHRPKVLILDEPTVGVDPQSRKHIFDEVRLLASEHEMAVLYTSHYMEEVQALCERIAIVDHGRVLAEGSVESLMKEHGRATIDIEFVGQASELAALSADFEVLELEGARLRVSMPSSVSTLLRAIEGAGLDIRSIKTQDADLESVFLKLTGHSLRDDS